MGCIMNVVRINVSLPQAIYQELAGEVEPGGRSHFIADAIKNAIKEKRNQKLAADYLEASQEIKRINVELEGAVADGID